jgi:hypothetical protein
MPPSVLTSSVHYPVIYHLILSDSCIDKVLSSKPNGTSILKLRWQFMSMVFDIYLPQCMLALHIAICGFLSQQGDHQGCNVGG